MSKTNSTTINLGNLQTAFESASKEYTLAEKGLKRAQDLRDAKRESAARAEQELRDATRAVLG